MNKKRYKEKYEEGSELLWPSEEEDKITRDFYRDLSHLSKNTYHNGNHKLNLFKQVLKIVNGQGGSTNIKKDEFHKNCL